MTHPEDLLAGYVDGTLPAKERAAVDAHVSGCDRCTREVALATAARGALASLGTMPAPAGLGDAALAEAGLVRSGTGVHGDPPRWYRFAAIAAAAAAVALILVVVLPNPRGGDRGGGDRTAVAEDASTEGGAAQTSAQTLVVQDVDYDPDTVASLVMSFKRASADGAAEPLAGPEFAAESRLATDRQTDRALRCVQQAAPDETGGLTSLVQARFQGTPAYLAVFVEGPGAGQPLDSVRVWVVARGDCRILHFTGARL
jgi:Putative zinc-finger